MYNKCCVPGCTSLRKDAKLHKLPKCEKRLRLWFDSIKCNVLRKLKPYELVYLQVCNKHFEKRFVTKKLRLLSTAYPTLFLESEIESGKPLDPIIVDPKKFLMDHPNIKKLHIDHNYCKEFTGKITEPRVGLPCKSEFVEEQDSPSKIQHNTAVPQLVLLPSTSESVGDGIMNYTQAAPHYDETSYVNDDFGHQTYDYKDEPVQSNSTPTALLDNTKHKLKFVPSVENLSPSSKMLYKKYKNACKLLNGMRQRKKTQKMDNKQLFEKMMEGMSPLAKKLLGCNIFFLLLCLSVT